MTASIPRATYRLQLHKDFDFAAAQAILPYLQALGVSHVYCSPITRARPGSLHGYDVADPREISPELGGREGFERFAMAARALDLQLLLDIVPNHMGVIGSDNPWWDDVLAHGQASAYAGFFDIDWRPLDPTMAGKLLLPLLGAPYGEVLERGELQLRWEQGAGVGAGCFVLAYFTHRVATDPGSWGAVLRLAADQAADADTAEALTALAERADAMPPREDLGAAGARERAAAAARLRQQLLACMAQRREAERAIDAALAWLNGAGGRDALHALLEVQAWRLGFWRVAADEINYRRFFDINELAALCVEDEQVFEATHALALDLTAAGIVDGLRIDHPDGLRDPAQYFARLQDGHARRRAQLRPDEPALPEGGRPLYVVAEKITAAHADLPQEWRLHGTTGYRFGALLNGLFSDRSQAARMERVWRGFTGAASSCEDMVFDAKLAVAQGALGADLSLLATQLKRIASANRRTRDYGFTTLRSAIAEVAAAMPVYRTYVVEQAGEQDQRFIDWAVAQARRRSAIADASVFDFLRACLLAEPTPGSGDDALLPVRRFAWRFQQFCAPLAAKGVEDCVFYRYLQLVSLNEVGGDPTAQGLTVQAFHGASADRAARWPHTLLATSTHDNKRSEDVRNRIAVLSERPALWRLGLMRWHQLTRSLRRELASGPAPSRDDELLLYQVLLGVLPSPDEGDMDAQGLAALRARVGAYMAKAAREAKLRTSWVRPDADYEQALQAFVDGLLGRLSPNPALADLRALARQLAWFGALNSLSMVVLKLSAPGVPDIYQGNEMQDLSLVDPDNRRPVDYALRQGTLAAHEALLLLGDADRLACLARMAATPADGRLKLWATWRLLALRREDPALLRDGAYIALRCSGRAREHVVAYARRTPEGLLVVLAARLFARLLKSLDAAPVGEACWGDASVDLTPALKDWNGGVGDVTALELLGHVPRRLPRGPLRLADALQTLPVAVYWVDARAGKQGA